MQALFIILPLSPSGSSPNKLWERMNYHPPLALLGEVPEGRRGHLNHGWIEQ